VSARPETELTVIAAAISGQKPARVSPADFTCPVRARIWRTILDLYTAGKDRSPTTVLAELDEIRDDVRPVLLAAFGEHVLPGKMDGYARILRECTQERRRKKLGQQLGEVAGEEWTRLFQKLSDTEARRNGYETRAIDIPSAVCDEPPPTPWVIPGWLAERDRVVLGGARKEGKSTLLADLAVSLAAGEDWLGMKVSSRRVLYVDGEQGDILARQRLGRIVRGRGMSDEAIAEVSLKLRYLRGNHFNLDDPGKLRQFEREVLDHEADFVFVDSLKRIHSRDENSNDEMSQFFSHVLDPMLDRCNCGLVVLHHVRKGSWDEETIVDALRGAGDIAAYVDTIWGYIREEDTRRLCCSLSRWDNTGTPVLVTMTPAGGEGFTLKGESAHDVVGAALQAHVDRSRNRGSARTALVTRLEDAGLGTDSAQKEVSRWVSRGRKNGDLCTERVRGRVTVWSRFFAPESVKTNP
jgi:hypothetical protein